MTPLNWLRQPTTITPLRSLPTATGNWTQPIRNGPPAALVIPARPDKPAELARRQTAAARLRRRRVHLHRPLAHALHTHYETTATIPDRVLDYINFGPVVQPLTAATPYELTIAAHTAHQIAAALPDHKWHKQWRARNITNEIERTIR